MTKKINNDLEDSNFKEKQDNVGKKPDQDKVEESKTLTEESSKKRETNGSEESSENSEIVSEEDNLDIVDALKKELSENKDKLLRAMADSENTRKQIEKIRIEANKYGVQPLAREILNVVDNFNRALNLKEDNNEKGLEEGLTLIQKEILNILEKFNVKKITALGEDFNANFHQAMFEKETNEFENGKVCEIVQDGYTFHDRLLRPVLVGVAKKSDENNNDEKAENNGNTKNEKQN